MVNFSNVLEEECFTFIVGPEKKKFNIHPGILEDVAPPLYALATNGKMEESITRIADLPEVEQQTFSRFCEYAYNIPILTAYAGRTSRGVEDYFPEIPDGLSSYHCRYDGNNCYSLSGSNLKHFPYCKQHYEMSVKSETAFCARCGKAMSTGGMPSPISPIFCGMCEKQNLPTESNTKKSSQDFRLLKYGVGVLTHAQVRYKLRGMSPSDHQDDTLCTHAKVYVFAEMYLIKDLKEICLHKLHRDLLVFDLTDNSIGEIVELLIYTYQNTSNNDDGTIGTGSALRKLVMMYVVDQIQQLIEYHEFRGMLSDGGSFAADVVDGIAKKLPPIS